jgi:AraC family transcriptional regulator, transcriptional activator of pobA
LSIDFKKLHLEFYTQSNYRTQILQSFLLSLLFKCKNLNDEHSKQSIKQSKKQELLFKFKNLVKNCYIQHKQVSDYANKLFVTANHLNDTVKEQTGRTAKEIINEQIILEAKKSLQYSVDDVSQIAYNLGFEEPSNFIRFFKNNTNQTPKEYRNSNL